MDAKQIPDVRPTKTKKNYTNNERWDALLSWTRYNRGSRGDAELMDNSQLKGKLTRCFRDWCPGRSVICLVLLGEPSNPLGVRWKKGVCGRGVRGGGGGVCLGQVLRLWWRTICQQESSLNWAQSCSTGPDTWLKTCMKWNANSSFFYFSAEQRA